MDCKYAPRSVESLCRGVHKKKVNEIRAWIGACGARVGPRPAHVLILQGAPGIGKSAAIVALAAELGIQLSLGTLM